MIGTIEQALADMKSGVLDLTDNGRCTGCGQCCSRYLSLTVKEIKTIKNYIKVHHIKAQNHTALIASPSYDMTCPFLDMTKTNKKCMIYAVRPDICRQFVCHKTSHGGHYIPHGNALPVDVLDIFYGESCG